MLSVIKNGIEYSLDDGTYCTLVGDEGWGAPPTHRLSRRGVLQNGDSDAGFRLDPRIASLSLFILGSNRVDLYQKRASLLDILSPSDTPIVIRWSIGDTVRDIDGHIMDGPLMGSEDRSGFAQRTLVTFRCSDPTFYNPIGNAETFELGGGSDALVIPMTVPMKVGTAVIDQTVAVSYNGSWPTNPTLVRIGGPITNAVVTNVTTGDKLDFTGTVIDAGDYYDIDLRYGIKTVKDSNGDNKIGDLTSDSDLSTFNLVQGTNSIRVQGTAVTEATTVYLSWFDRYTGI